MAMKEVFFSDFHSMGPWITRHTPDPDLVASDSAPKITDTNRLLMRLRMTPALEVRTTHLYVPTPFQFGRFEARMRFAGPKGAHSCFWLQDEVPNQLGGSEVDIIEHFGSDKTLWSNVYWREEPDHMWPNKPMGWRQSTQQHDPRQWHIYGLEWHPDRYVFTIDGKVHAVSGSGLSSMPKVMILSLLSSEWEWPNLQREALWKYRTLVDWVRVCQ